MRKYTPPFFLLSTNLRSTDCRNQLPCDTEKRNGRPRNWRKCYKHTQAQQQHTYLPAYWSAYPCSRRVTEASIWLFWNLISYRVHAKSLQSCPTLCNPTDHSSPGSSVHGILQARILEWVTISYSRGSSRSRDRTRASCVSYIGRRILYHYTTWKAH